MSCSNNQNFIFERLPLEIHDFSSVDPTDFIDKLDLNPEKEIKGLIAHCTGGTGRTGFFLAAYIMKLFSLFDPVEFKNL